MRDNCNGKKRLKDRLSEWLVAFSGLAAVSLVAAAFISWISRQSFGIAFLEALVSLAVASVAARFEPQIERPWIRWRLRRKREQILTDPAVNPKVFSTIDKAYRATQDLQGCVEEWRGLARECPSSPRVHVYLGKACLDKELYPEAVEALKRARELEPGSVEITSLLGQAYLGSKEYVEGLKELRSAHEAAPNNAEVSQYLIVALLLNDLAEEAHREATAFCAGGGRLARQVRRTISELNKRPLAARKDVRA